MSFNRKYRGRVSLYSTEGGGDFNPDRKFLEENREIESMFRLSRRGLDIEVLFRNLYPPRVTGMRGDLNLLNSYGWEESSLPIEYIEQFNRNLDGITVMSNYVKRVLISNGVDVPIEVVGLGVGPLLEIEPVEFNLKQIRVLSFYTYHQDFQEKV